MACHAFLLAVDQDEVLLSPSGALREPAGVEEFARARADCPDLVLAYLTECHLFQALERIRSAGLPEPDFLIGEVGTTLYQRTGDTYALDAEYRSRVAAALGAVDAATLRHIVAEAVPQLVPQEFDHQGEFKLSYYIDAWRDFQALIAALRQALRHIDARVQMSFSIDRADGRGRLRILPRGVRGILALERLGARTGCRADWIVYAAGSESEALEAVDRGHPCILVGAASTSGQDALETKASGRGARVYFARRAGAAGVMEGCRALAFLERG